MRRLPRPRVRRQLIYRIDTPAALATLPPDPAVSIEPITRANHADVRAFRAESTQRAFATLLELGDLGVFARVDGQVCGHAWAASGRRVGGYFAAQADEGFVHYCNVDPARRGHGLYPRMLVALAARCLAEGKARVLIDTAVDNIPSQRGLLKAGFRPVAYGVYVQLGGRLLRAQLSGDPRAGA